MSLVDVYSWFLKLYFHRFSKLIVFTNSETEIIMVFTCEYFFSKIPFGYVAEVVVIAN